MRRTCTVLWSPLMVVRLHARSVHDRSSQTSREVGGLWSLIKTGHVNACTFYYFFKLLITVLERTERNESIAIEFKTIKEYNKVIAKKVLLDRPWREETYMNTLIYCTLVPKIQNNFQY